MTCVLTQSYEHTIDEKKIEILHPMTYKSDLFHGNHKNQAALMKEA